MFDKIKKQNMRKLIILLSLTLAWGLFAHGIMFGNKYSFHDDAGNVGLGSTYTSGRWLLEVMLRVQKNLLGSENFSLPWYNGIISLVFIGIAAYLIIDILEINSKLSWVALTGVMATFPAITGLFGYMFTAPAYMFGMCLAVTGAYLICKKRSYVNWGIGVLLIACSIGVYQAYMPLAVCIFVLYFFHRVLIDEENTWKGYLQSCVYYIGSCISFLILYVMLNKFYLVYFNAQLNDYQGISSFGATDIKGYFLRLLRAYKEFLLPTSGLSRNMYPFTIERFYQVMLLGIACILVTVGIKVLKNNVRKFFEAFLLMAIFPMATNLIYIMCDANAQPGIHSLMMYAQVAPFILFVYLTEKYVINSTELKIKCKRILTFISLFLVIFISVMYVRLANICYLKADYLQTQAISYFTRLIERIETTDGYDPYYTVLFVNNREKFEMPVPAEFDQIKIVPYERNSIINTHTWYSFMKTWCGYQPYFTYDESVVDSEIIEAMPSYPAEGSIKVVNDIVVVKF